jgi:TRAP-type C4-dicarboxylate transport system permease large subunit
VYKTVIPFFLLLLAVLVLITYFPGLSLALSGAVGMQ